MRRWTGVTTSRPGDGPPARPSVRPGPGSAVGGGPSSSGIAQFGGRPSAGSSRRLDNGGSGQASVEFLAVLPVAAVVAITAAQVLAAGLSAELAGHAAEAAAIAVIREEDPRAAARDALPGWSRDRVSVRVTDRSVRVRLPPPTLVPGLAEALTASAHADAGPRP